MSMTRFRHLSLSVVTAVAVMAAADTCLAEDVKMFEKAPSVAELEKALGASSKPKVKTRSIVFGNDPAPAPQPQPQQQAQPQQQQQQYSAPQQQQYTAAQQPAPQPQQQPQQQSQASSDAVGFPINFAINSATIRPDAVPFLNSIAGLMSKNPSMSLMIEGHTDASGSYFHNMELSNARAFSVMNYLSHNLGISAGRLQAKGMGPTQPLAGTNPYDAKNRRVQFRVMQ